MTCVRRIAIALLLACAACPCVAVLAQENPPPSLTAIEEKDKEILALHRQLTTAYKTIAELQGALGTCQGTLGPYQLSQNQQALSAEQMALKTRVQERTGYAWDPETGKFGEKLPPPEPKAVNKGG